MVPGQPGEVLAVRANARRRIEIIASYQDVTLMVAALGDGDEGVNGFAATGAVILTDADKAVAGVVHGSIGVAQGCLGRDRDRLFDWPLAVEMLVGNSR